MGTLNSQGVGPPQNYRPVTEFSSHPPEIQVFGANNHKHFLTASPSTILGQQVF